MTLNVHLLARMGSVSEGRVEPVNRRRLRIVTWIFGALFLGGFWYFAGSALYTLGKVAVAYVITLFN